MALSTQNKWIIGIASALGLTLIAVATKKYWMPNKDTNKNSGGITLELKQDAVPTSSGDASHKDAIGQKYNLTADYNAMQENSKKIVSADFKKGSSFEKKSDKNLTSLNGQNALIVFAKSNSYIIPVTLLKKS